jgi:hypothetical protein
MRSLCQTSFRPIGTSQGNPILQGPRRVRYDRCGDRVMNAPLILIDSDSEFARPRGRLRKRQRAKQTK